MKTKGSFILKAGISLILCFLMLFGTVTTSLAAVVDELAETGSGSLSSLPAGMVVYFHLDSSRWNNPSTVYAYFFTTASYSSASGQYTRVTSTKNSDGYFTATVPNDGKTYNSVQFRSANSVNSGNYTNTHQIDYVWNNTIWDNNSGNWNDFTNLGTYIAKKTNSQGKIYFDNSLTQWTGNIYLLVARATDSWYVRADKMTADADAPDIYYYNLSSTFSDGYTAIGFANTGSNTMSSSSDFSTAFTNVTKKTTWISAYGIDGADKTFVGTPVTSGSNVAYNLDYKSGNYNYFDSTYTLNVGAHGSAKIDGYQFTAHGSATANSTATANAGSSTTMAIAKSSTVTITPTPSDGYVIDSVTLDSASGTALTNNGDGTYSYKADGSAHSIHVSFKAYVPPTLYLSSQQPTVRLINETEGTPMAYSSEYGYYFKKLDFSNVNDGLMTNITFAFNLSDSSSSVPGNFSYKDGYADAGAGITMSDVTIYNDNNGSGQGNHTSTFMFTERPKSNQVYFVYLPASSPLNPNGSTGNDIVLLLYDLKKIEPKTEFTVTLNKNAADATAGTTSVTATIGQLMPAANMPTRTGYAFAGYYDTSAATGGKQYYTAAGASANTWDKEADTTLYARWTEVKAGATVMAYTDSEPSGTGGTVKVDTGAAGATATISDDTFGIDTASPAIIKASTTAGYEFKGWQFNSTHLKYSFDGTAYTAVASTSTTYGTSSDTTVYVKTDGASGMTTANTEIHAMFESAKYTITDNGAYHKTGAAGYVSGTTGGTFTVSQTGSLNYNTNLTLTATAASGYAVDGIYWSNDSGSTWTKVTTTDTTSNDIVTASTNNSFKVTDNFTLKAMFVQVCKLSAFNSYEKINDNVTFVTAPPKKIEVKHTDSEGTSTTYTYSYDGTKSQGNPDSPDVVNASGTLAIATGTYGQGNYIQYYAGDEITLTYSAMATSEILKGVFYKNSTNFYVNKPTSEQFVAHTHPSTPAIYMNSAYYTGAEIDSRSFSGVTVDNDAHSIKFTATDNYKNIDVEIGKKRKVYFSDYTNTVITSKNTDDYYYDNEDLSVTGDQLTVKAKQSDVQTNSITATSVRYYKANADGTKGDELTADEKTALGLSITGSTSTSTSSADGEALVFNGHMPAYDLYIDLNMSNSYTLKLGTKIVSDLGGSKTRLQEAATTISIAGSTTLNANTSGDVTSGSTSVSVGSSATLTVSGLTSGYMFVGWYWGSDSAPDYEKGFISDKLTLSYSPRKGGTIWAVGTKDLFINGSKYITGKDTDWYSEGGTQKNLEMKFEASTGRYYWEITDTMFVAAGSNYKTWEENNNNTTYGTYHKGGDNCYYWYDNDDKYHGKSFFQFFDTASGNDNNKSIWNNITSFKVDTPANGPTYGKIYPSANDYGTKTWNGQGFINFNETNYTGYSSPLRIYYDPNASGNARLTVEATPIYSDIYVSNGFDVGSTLKSDATTVEPVVDGVVKTSGQSGYFSVGAGTTYSPDHEGTVTKYTPAKKGATVRITKKAGGSDKIAAFLIYDIKNKTVRAEKNITAGTAVSGKTPYYFDLTLANEKQELYIVPIIEESGAKVTITFDASQLNRKQWGDIVTAYAWYSSTNNPALGAYPGQPMIPSDDMSTWTTSFPATKGGNELAGITFTNYVDGIHSWLGCTGVMGEVSDHKTGAATGGIINVYNHVDSGTNGEYSRTNYKAQTYDYHEPIALYDRYKNEDSVNITFQMKDGNSSLISWKHTEFDDNNILNLPSDWGTLNWEYLTNAKGDQYIDMNGNPLGANNKPSATFYVAAKGQVVYKTANNKPTMKYVFHGGHGYEMQGYSATYSDPASGQERGSYSKSALASGQWDSAITYDAPGVVNSGMEMKYGVQWYVYDAAGNYITTVLSAGIADLSSNEIDTYLGKQLEDMGYAVDGKSVAICYDKPRYMYGDWSDVLNSAENINCGPNFDAYRFEGQWIAAANTDTVKVNVEVAMMTDSGEVLARSNTAGYGNASAALVSGITFKAPHAITAPDGSWAQTAATDAKLNGIVLNASSQNFIGWYYYDANTGEFTEASYESNEGFRPNYSNKDVTYYAVYRASAVYNYIYRGRESNDDVSTWRVYSAAGEDLTPEEMAAGGNQNKVQYDNHSDDVLSKLPVGIGVFKKNIDFSRANAGSWDKNNDTQYILKLSGFTVTSPTYTLTAHYKNANGDLVTISDTAVYNDKAVNLTTGEYTDSKNATKPAGTPVTSYQTGFIGWYEYDPTNDTTGDLLSTQANYGMRLTKNQHIIAKYVGSLPSDGWNAFIDENEVNKELTTKDTGVFYNDTIVRVRNGSDVKAELPTGAKIGVILVCDNKTNKTINQYSKDQLNNLVTNVQSGKTKKTASGLSITNMQAAAQTSFNRTDIAVRADYAKTLGSKYCVYAYIYDGNDYHFSAPSEVKTYE